MEQQIIQSKRLKGTIRVPGDKSISHRAIMMGAMAEGVTTVDGFLPGEDCLSTISCFQQMGVDIKQEGSRVVIHGKGLKGFKEPAAVLDVGNSGTTIRLMSGILAGLPGHFCIQGDASIAKRPMNRVMKPLMQMGATVDGRENGSFTPISIRGGALHSIDFLSPIASAQVKSAILLAGLQADGRTSVTEPERSRDHTERMLQTFGVDIEIEGKKVSLLGKQRLKAASIKVPGDISSAAFFMVASMLVPDSCITIQSVGMNPTRTGIIDVLEQMGARLSLQNQRMQNFEPEADIEVHAAPLKGVVIGGSLIPRLIDELPIIALAATQAEGTTIIKDAAELKVKETNRIDTVAGELTKMGANIETTSDGMIIHGKTPLKGARVNSHGDHRIGMMLAIASCIAEGETVIENKEAVKVSFPEFFESLQMLQENE
ncbi:3-phosphoshikimate 1-carboxyvinyltransferase [Heyndrickxia acidicola]|uniref:3-phosphoshikimate 1-carboxyvinyltransferase n=1 Tax=Heyndrickxia acidicola TaxID=209389 RepID=A0ABU6MH13_9BACI|nr:3-phosphoshikimate 1-carboxyvinyltransferase [Heyndrickxia acidicola]MED1203966.1 3-phosphoshikimate 1-carboxyvinyltransferase [Heyndrickxia acidicola]